MYSQCAVTDPTLPSCKAQLVKWTSVPANSQALVEVWFSSWGSMLPSPGMMSPVTTMIAKHGVMAGRHICRIPVMNLTERTVGLLAGTTVGVLQPA